MNKLIELPNIGKTLSEKLVAVGIKNEQELKLIGSENAINKIATIENSGACINMLYALEGAIQGILQKITVAGYTWQVPVRL